MKITNTERFWRKVDRRDPHECWEWQGGTKGIPYGVFLTTPAFKQRKVTIPSRYSWELHHGPVPEGMCVLHRCDNPPCVNPAHLFLGTPSDNTQDMLEKGRHPSRAGEANGWASLTEADVREMRRLYGEGMRNADIARHMGLDPRTTHRIVRRKSWAHI